MLLPTYPYLHDLHAKRQIHTSRGTRNSNYVGQFGWNELLARRLSAVAALLSFIYAYLCGIAIYGLPTALAFIWLPAGLLAWGVARLTFASLTAARTNTLSDSR